MKLKSVLLTPKLRAKFDKDLGHLNIPFSSEYELHSFLSEIPKGICKLDNLTRILLKPDGVYLEGDVFAVDQLIYDFDEKKTILRSGRRNTMFLSLGLGALGLLASYVALAASKYPTVDFCFSPRILHSTPRQRYCRSGETVYRTHPKFLLDKDQVKPNPNFILSSDKYLIPAKGRKIRNINKPTNPNYIMYSLFAMGLTGAAYFLYSQSASKYALEFPEYFGRLRTYTLKQQLQTNQRNVLAHSENHYRTDFLNREVRAFDQGTAMAFASDGDLAAQQAAIEETNEINTKRLRELDEKQFALQLAELDKQINENRRDAYKAESEIGDGSKSGKKKANAPSEAQIKEEGNKLVNAVKAFGFDIKYEGASLAPAVVRHKFKFNKTAKLENLKKLSEDLGLALELEQNPRIARDKGNIIIEIPRKERDFPTIFDALPEIKPSKHKEGSLQVLGGFDTDGKLFMMDLANSSDCHFLGVGGTGSGKTQGIYAQIAGIVHQYSPQEVQLAIYDGKNGLFLPEELKPWLFCPTAFASEGKDFIQEIEIERANRQKLRASLSREKKVGCRNLQEYNKHASEKLPIIFVIMDEYSVDKAAFEGEDDPESPDYMTDLGKLARSEGIHLSPYDQEATHKHLSNRVKANLLAQAIFKVAKKKIAEYHEVDGAENLLGKGDLIIKFEGKEKRCQMPNCSPEDLTKICQDRKKELNL